MSILSLVKGIFKAPKAIDNILDKDKGLLTQVGGWIGNLSYTDEEKSKDTQELVKGVVDYAKSTLSENTERSKTRRDLAINIMRAELFLVLLSVVIWKLDKEYAEFIWKVASSTLMSGAFWAVVVFFFGAYGYGQHVKGKKK